MSEETKNKIVPGWQWDWQSLKERSAYCPRAKRILEDEVYRREEWERKMKAISGLKQQTSE